MVNKNNNSAPENKSKHTVEPCLTRTKQPLQGLEICYICIKLWIQNLGGVVDYCKQNK